jgi:hypothetical protein
MQGVQVFACALQDILIHGIVGVIRSWGTKKDSLTKKKINKDY